MDQQEKQIEQIDQYLNGQLTEQEKKDFELSLEEDDELKALFEFVSDTQKAQAVNELTSLKAQLSNTESNYKRRRQNTRYLKVAASIILLATLGYFIYNATLQSADTTVLFDKYYKVYPNVVAPVSRDEETTDNIFTTYEKGNYQEVIDALGTVENPSDTSSFYLGQAHMALGNYMPAIKAFDMINTASGFYDQALWYRALANLKLQNLERCQADLQQLVVRKSSYQQKAEALINAL